MKTLHLATGLLLAASLFTACKKDRYDMTTSPVLSSQTKTSLPANAVVKFTSGTLMTRQLLISGNGRTVLESHDMQKLDLFAPLNKAGLNLPMGGYDNFRISADAFQNSGAPSLYLHGSFTTSDGSVVPVSFMINSVLRLTSDASVMNLNESANLMNLLNMEPDYLTANITQDEWTMAMQETKDLSNGEILVSEQHNVALYKRILDNLQTMLHVSYTYTPPGATDPLTGSPATDNGAVQ